MTTKQKLKELINRFIEGSHLTSWEQDFIESFETYAETEAEDIPDLSSRQEETVDNIYEKYFIGD